MLLLYAVAAVSAISALSNSIRPISSRGTSSPSIRSIFNPLFVGGPLGDSAQPHLGIGVLEGERGKSGDQDFAKLALLEGGRGGDAGGEPQQVAEPLGALGDNGLDLSKRNPEIVARAEYLETRANARIAVGDGLEWLSVDRPRYLRRRLPERPRVGGFLEHFAADAFGVKRSVIQKRPGQRILAAFAEHGQVLFGAVIIALEAKQLE